MNFYISYCVEFNRVIAGIVLESRQNITAIKNKSGFEVKAFFDNEIDKVGSDVLPYKMETETGTLAAYFSLRVTGTAAVLYQLFIRHNFAEFATEISGFISNFISNGSYKSDILEGESIV